MKKAVSLSLMLLLWASLYVPAVLAWSLERPSDTININDRIDVSGTDDYGSVGLGIHIDRYDKNHPTYDGNDVLWLRISAPANVRKGIDYEAYAMPSFHWDDVDESVYNLLDGQSVTVYLPFALRFYGAAGSGEYSYVTVSGDGVIHLSNPEDPTVITDYPYYPGQIPSIEEPNSFIAPLWRNLQTGVIRTGQVLGPNNRLSFAITWERFQDNVGNLQTFQVVIEEPLMIHRQNNIWFSYQSITTNVPTTVGIEDQQGGKGLSCDYQYLHDGLTLFLGQSSQSGYISQLTVNLEETDPYAIVDIDEDPDNGNLLGFNTEPEPTGSDSTIRFAKALGGTAALLLTTKSRLGSITHGAGVMISRVLFLLGWVDALASLFSPIDKSQIDFQDGHDQNWLKVTVEGVPVDAGIGIFVRWKLTDQNRDQDHSIKISAKLDYFSYDYWDGQHYGHSVSTEQVELRLDHDANNSYETAISVSPGTYSGFFLGGTDIEDYFKVNADVGQVIYVTMHPPSDADFDMYLYSPDDDTPPRRLRDQSEMRGNGLAEQVYYTASMAGFWYIEMTKSSDRGFYAFTVYVYYPEPPGEGGCPYVSTWNGSRYVLDNNLIAAAEKSNGTDVVDYYMIQKPPVQDQGKYPLLIWDQDKHSFLDRVQLIAVDHESDVNIAVSPDGQILTYKEPIAPITGFNKNGTDILNLINAQDDQYYQGYPGDYIQLDFGLADIQDGAKLVMRTDPLPPCDPGCKMSIHIQTLNATGQWVDVTSFIPRLYWSIDIFDLSNHLPDVNGDLRLRLYFTADHKLDYAGLDTSKQGEFDLHNANLVEANHNRLGDVKDLFRNSDNLYVELLPSEQVELKFTLPTNTNEKRDFIIILEGHYFIP